MSQLIVDRAAHTYTLHGARKVSVTDALARTSIVDTTWYTEASRERGKDAHHATVLYDSGTLDARTITAEIEPFLLAWVDFRKHTGFQPDMDLRETSHYNDEYDFCGSPDAPGILDGSLAIVEIKTGGLPWWAGLQTAGYDILLGGGWRRITVHLKANGTFKMKDWNEEPNAMDDRSDFLAAVRLAQRLMREKRS